MATMEGMLQQAVKLEDAQKKRRLSTAAGWGLQGLRQVGGAIGAWNDSRAYSGFEEQDEVGAAVAATGFERLVQGDVAGAVVSWIKGRELQAQERLKRQKEKRLKLKTDLRELKRGIQQGEKEADKGYGQRLAQASNEAQRYAFGLYQSASGVASGNAQRAIAGAAVRAEAEAEAPARFLAEKLDRLADVRAALESEIDDSLKSHPGRLKHEERLQAAIDDVMEL